MKKAIWVGITTMAKAATFWLALASIPLAIELYGREEIHRAEKFGQEFRTFEAYAAEDDYSKRAFKNGLGRIASYLVGIIMKVRGI